jgi:hypothetical protein
LDQVRQEHPSVSIYLLADFGEDLSLYAGEKVQEAYAFIAQ